MVRSELLQKLCNIHPNIIRRDMEKILEIVFAEIIESLRRGENIEIRGLVATNSQQGKQESVEIQETLSLSKYLKKKR